MYQKNSRDCELKEGVRVPITKKENWYLNKHERLVARKVITFLKKQGQRTLTDLYLHVGYSVDSRDLTDEKYRELFISMKPYTRLRVKCVVLVLWKMNRVACKYNNGICLIKIKPKSKKKVREN